MVSLGALLTADGYGIYDLSLYEKRAVANAERQMRQFVRRVRFGGAKFETIVESGACISQSVLQWGSRVSSLAIVERSVLSEHSGAERHGDMGI